MFVSLLQNEWNTVYMKYVFGHKALWVIWSQIMIISSHEVIKDNALKYLLAFSEINQIFSVST
jgi:hypothetical protein